MVRTTISAVVVTMAVGVGMVHADQVILDDLVVNGSACVGIPCADMEDFGFDTLRLKGDELRMSFIDTSTTAAFPTTDWRITINDDDAGMISRFSIDDLDAGTTPFTIEAGAPNGSLYVDGAGRVGIGTSAPATDAALDVRGTLRVDGDVDVTGTIGVVGIKAGIIPEDAFEKGQASVTFASPYAGNYLILLTAVSAGKPKPFKPTVLERDATGFTLTAGKKNTKRLAEVHWMTQPVTE